MLKGLKTLSKESRERLEVRVQSVKRVYIYYCLFLGLSTFVLLAANESELLCEARLRNASKSNEQVHGERRLDRFQLREQSTRRVSSREALRNGAEGGNRFESRHAEGDHHGKSDGYKNGRPFQSVRRERIVEMRFPDCFLSRRGARGQSQLRELLQPLVSEIIANKSLIFHTSPVDVYKAWINQMEQETGQAR